MLGIKALKTSGSDLNLKSVHAAIQSHWSQSKGLGLGPRAYHLQPCDLGQTPRCSRLPFHKLKMIIILSFRVGLQELKYNDTMYVKQLTAQWHREGIDKKTIFIVVPILHNNWQNLRGHLQTGLSQEQQRLYKFQACSGPSPTENFPYWTKCGVGNQTNDFEIQLV